MLLTRLFCLILVLLILGATLGLLAGGRPAGLEVSPYDGGFFTIKVPRNWHVLTAGSCSDFAFVVRDPSEPLRQIFYFGQVGPVYLCEQQRQIDEEYVAMGGYPIIWLDTPVVKPLTPAGFLLQFEKIARTESARRFMPECPKLERLQIISETPRPAALAGAKTALLRAVFIKGGRVGQGQFLVSVAEVMPFTGQPSQGIGYGFMIAGITAEKREFADLEPVLARSLSSLRISKAYVENCIAQQRLTWAGILKAGRTLSQTADTIVQGWQHRARTYDIIAEKRADAILGLERLYDPHTRTVYQFKNGFYDKYRLARHKFQMSNLRPLPPDDYELWTKAPLDGPKHLH